jgi:D-alanyl-lipoteichoic acid acyltransferase DltB (MBOAT superfamily)
MSLASLQFLIALFLLAAVFFYLPGRRLRQVMLASCNAGFLYLLIPNSASWAALGIFLLSGYGMAWLLRKWPSTSMFSLYLVAMVAAFLVIRKYDVVTAHFPISIAAHAVSIVGLSYMLFRQTQFLVDAFQEQVERTSLWEYANFQLNLFALLSGPIQRYQDFQEQWKVLDPILKNVDAVRRAYIRLFIGIVKMGVLATVFMSLYQKSAEMLTSPIARIEIGGTAPELGRSAAIVHFLGIFYFYPIYLYLNFSGYCDVVIAGASLVGIRLPENFDRPWLARNVIDFWTRWHRTLGFWIRDYLFLPLYKGVAERWPGRAESLAFLCYFTAFFVAGIWHGPTANFVIYGLLQAIGVSAAKLWERHILKRRGRAGLKEYLQSANVRAVAIAGTLHFECFSLLFFPVDVHTTVQMLQAVWRAII